MSAPQSVGNPQTLGPFPTRELALKRLTIRAAELAEQAGQVSSPHVRLREAEPRSWTGLTSARGVIYRPWSDTIELVCNPRPNEELDAVVVDGMLLHGLGHRSRRRIHRVVYASGVVLAALGLVLALSGAWIETPSPWMTAAAGVLATTGLVWTAAIVRVELRAEARADDYALTRGGLRPILAFLRRHTETHPHLAHRVQRIQRVAWRNSTLN